MNASPQFRPVPMPAAVRDSLLDAALKTDESIPDPRHGVPEGVNGIFSHGPGRLTCISAKMTHGSSDHGPYEVLYAWVSAHTTRRGREIEGRYEVISCGCLSWHFREGCDHAVLADDVLNSVPVKALMLNTLAAEDTIALAYPTGTACHRCPVDTEPGELLSFILRHPGRGRLGYLWCPKCRVWVVNSPLRQRAG